MNPRTHPRRIDWIRVAALGLVVLSAVVAGVGLYLLWLLWTVWRGA